MPSATARVNTPQVAAINGMSKSTNSQVALTGNSLAIGDYPTLSLVVGKAASPPVAFSGFANPVTLPASADNWDSVTARSGPGVITVTWAGVLPLANAAWSPGDQVYIGIFNVLTPAGSDAPVAVAGPFLVIA